ncbi:MAG: carbon-nitrogen hydrolase family protein [Pseudomonadota bacterium]
MKLALVQLVSTASVDANLARTRVLLEQAAQQGAELAVLPEYFCLLGHGDEAKLRIRETPGQGPIQDFLSCTARELGLWIVGGTLPIDAGAAVDEDRRAYNSTRVYSPQGDCVAQYDKIHLFRYDNGRESYDEARTLRPGRQPVVFDLLARDGQTWRVGLSVCYDLRFPELYRAHAQAGAQLLLVPSAFTHTTGQAHWEPLLRARAIENLAYVAAAAQGGRHENGRRTWGHSMVVDPWGRVLDVRPEGEGLVLAELDAGLLRQCRQQLPALEHRVL